MEEETTVIPVAVGEGRQILVEARAPGGEQEIADDEFGIQSLDGVLETIGDVAGAVADLLAKVKPDSAEVEFGVELTAETGKLTALLVKGGGKATFKVKLAWGAA